jgi:MFS family permease
MHSVSFHRSDRAAVPRWFYAFVPVNIANGATSPLIPLYMVLALHASVLEVGLVFFFTSLAAVPGCVFWGRISDRLRRRRAFVLVGLASFGVTLPLMAVTDSLAVYLAANAALGFLQAAGAATSAVLIMESFEERHWAREMGRFAQVSGVAFVAGLVAGALWFAALPGAAGDHSALVMLFLVAAAMSVISAAIGALVIKEGSRHVDRARASEVLANLGHSILERRRALFVRVTHLPSLSLAGVVHRARGPTAAYCAGIFLLFTGFLVFNAPLPVFLLNEAGLAQSMIFWVYVANSVIAAALYMPAGRRCESSSPRRLLAAASLARAAIYPGCAAAVLLFGAGSAPTILLLLALNAAAGASWAYINVGGSVLAARIAPPNAKAQVTGVYNAAIGAGSIAGSLLGAVLAQHLSFLLVFASASAVILAGVGVIARASARGADATSRRQGLGRRRPAARDL